LRADLAIKGGTVVSATLRRLAHVYISDGTVLAVGTDELESRQVVDATGLLVLPGMVDTHVHLMDPGDTSREDFPTGSAAAAAAGVTTIIEHSHQHPVRNSGDLDAKRAHLEGRSHVDYGLAAHVWPDDIDGLGELWGAGVVFFKIFTCTTHGVPGLVGDTLARALKTIASCGGIALVHAEDETLTTEAERRLRDQGRDDNGLLLEWRSREAELVAVAEVCRIIDDTGVNASIAHVSSSEVAELVVRSRDGGADIGAEACPHYFALREDEVHTQGPLRKFTPPARARTDAETERMWELFRSGAFTHVATDHAPSTLAQKAAGIWNAPFGLPGLDTTGPFLIDAALRGKIDIEDVVRLYSESPARRYGLYPRKGTLNSGSDADVVLVDPEATWQVRDEEVISKAGWTPYRGRTWQGRVRASYSRGELIASERTPTGRTGGTFLTGAGAKAADTFPARDG
jgi:dihydroorotase